MIIFTARADTAENVRDTCFQAAELCNRLDIGIDLTIGDHKIEVRQGSHPYNLEQAYARAVREAEAGDN